MPLLTMIAKSALHVLGLLSAVCRSSSKRDVTSPMGM